MSISTIAETAVHAAGCRETRTLAADACARIRQPFRRPDAAAARRARRTTRPHAGSHFVDAIRKQDGQMEAALEQVETLSANAGALTPTQQMGRQPAGVAEPVARAVRFPDQDGRGVGVEVVGGNADEESVMSMRTLVSAHQTHADGQPAGGMRAARGLQERRSTRALPKRTSTR